MTRKTSYHTYSYLANHDRFCDVIFRITASGRESVPEKQMVYDWKTDGSEATVIAAKLNVAKEFLKSVEGCAPENIAINAEGVAKSWIKFAKRSTDNALVSWWHDDVIELVYIKNSKLSCVRKLFIDTDELDKDAGLDQLADDLRLLQKESGLDQDTIVCILGTTKYSGIIKKLKTRGVNLKPAKLAFESVDGDFSEKDRVFTPFLASMFAYKCLFGYKLRLRAFYV